MARNSPWVLHGFTVMFGRFYKAAAFVDVAVMITRWGGVMRSVSRWTWRETALKKKRNSYGPKKENAFPPHTITVVQRLQKVQEKQIVRRNMPQCEMHMTVADFNPCNYAFQALQMLQNPCPMELRTFSIFGMWVWAVDLVHIISHIQVTNNKPSSKAKATITLGLIGYANGWIGYTSIPNILVLCCSPESQTFSVFLSM